MAAGDLVQQGAVVHVGFGGNTNTNLVMQAVTETVGMANKKAILGEQNATVTKIYTDPGKRIRLTGVLKNAASDDAELTAVRAMKIGDEITVNSVIYCIDEAPEIEHSAEEARVALVAIREDSMGATYDA